MKQPNKDKKRCSDAFDTYVAQDKCNCLVTSQKYRLRIEYAALVRAVL